MYSSCLFPTLAQDGDEWSVSCPGCTLLLGKDPRYPLDRRLGGPQSWSGQRLEKNPLPLLVIEPRSSGCPICSLTLYWLSYPAPEKKQAWSENPSEGPLFVDQLLHYVQIEETNYKNLFLQLNHVRSKHELPLSCMVTVLTNLWLVMQLYSIERLTEKCSKRSRQTLWFIVEVCFYLLIPFQMGGKSVLDWPLACPLFLGQVGGDSPYTCASVN
jgi:hypothetical protein